MSRPLMDDCSYYCQIISRWRCKLRPDNGLELARRREVESLLLRQLGSSSRDYLERISSRCEFIVQIPQRAKRWIGLKPMQILSRQDRNKQSGPGIPRRNSPNSPLLSLSIRAIIPFREAPRTKLQRMDSSPGRVFVINAGKVSQDGRM